MIEVTQNQPSASTVIAISIDIVNHYLSTEGLQIGLRQLPSVPIREPKTHFLQSTLSGITALYLLLRSNLYCNTIGSRN